VESPPLPSPSTLCRPPAPQAAWCTLYALHIYTSMEIPIVTCTQVSKICLVMLRNSCNLGFKTSSRHEINLHLTYLLAAAAGRPRPLRVLAATSPPPLWPGMRTSRRSGHPAARITIALITVQAEARGRCNFAKDVDWQMKPSPDIKTVDAASAEECCSECLALEGCAFAAWNGPEFKRCYLKKPGCHSQPSPGTTGCQVVRTAAAGGGWGLDVLSLLAGATLMYLVVGAAYGRMRPHAPRRRGWHPHQEQWRELRGLVMDGLAVARGGQLRGPASPPPTSRSWKRVEGRSASEAAVGKGVGRPGAPSAKTAEKSLKRHRASKGGGGKRSSKEKPAQSTAKQYEPATPLLVPCSVGGGGQSRGTLREVYDNAGRHQSQAAVVVRVEQ
jgi:hypothetical protein